MTLRGRLRASEPAIESDLILAVCFTFAVIHEWSGTERREKEKATEKRCDQIPLYRNHVSNTAPSSRDQARLEYK
jgi:hypothetical protein